MFDFDKEFEQMMKTYVLDTVVILAHRNPDGDAAGSVMGLAHYIHMNYPQIQVLPYLSDALDKGPKRIVLTDKVFQPFDNAEQIRQLPQSKHYGVIVCDTATKARMIGLEFYENAAASMVIDHHLSNEGYGEINYTRSSEACAENIFGILHYEKLKYAQTEPGPTAADYLYLGMIHDTNGFDRAAVTTMEAAAELQKLGVNHRELMKTLQTDTMEDLMKRFRILQLAKREMDGKVAYVIISRAQIREMQISYEDIHQISGILRDCDDIELGFTMYEEKPDRWRSSFRSDGKWVDVNELLTPFGGGGHAAAAGLRVETAQVERLARRILDAIRKGQKN